MIFVINGYPRSGKDTVVEIWRRLHPDHTVANYSTAELPKKIVTGLLLYPANEAKAKALPHWRADVSRCKALLETEIDYVYMQLSWLNLTNDVVFCHCREPKSIARIVEQFGAHNALKTVFVQNDNAKDAYLEGHNYNPSDDAVEQYDYDIVLYNNGTLEDLEAEVRAKMRPTF